MTSETPPSQSQPDPPGPDLANEFAELKRENQDLRAQLDRIEKRAELAAAGRRRAWGFTWRILVPLLDRKKVVRNFTKLASTTAEFVNPPDRWPTRERVLKDANDLMTSVVRFIIRRRMFFLLFTIIATSIPFIQVYLVVQQNELIDKTNDLFQVQVNDMIARAMTDDDDPNTRRMAVALLANAKTEVMSGVVHEIFDPEITERNLRSAESSSNKVVRRRLRESGFRAHLMRAVGRSVHIRAGKVNKVDLYKDSVAMFDTILKETAKRLPHLLKIRSGDVAGIKDGILQEAEFYVFHVGYVVRQYGRLARGVGNNSRFYKDITALLNAFARADIRKSYFADQALQALAEIIVEVGLKRRLGTPAVDVDKEKIDVDAQLKAGLERLKKEIGADAVDWQKLSRQLRIN